MFLRITLQTTIYGLRCVQTNKQTSAVDVIRDTLYKSVSDFVVQMRGENRGFWFTTLIESYVFIIGHVKTSYR